MPAPNVLKQLSGKWKLELLYLMKDGPLRWGELTRLLPQAAPNALTRQLRELEADGLIIRSVYSVKPPKVVSYALSCPALIPLLEELAQFLHEESEVYDVS